MKTFLIAAGICLILFGVPQLAEAQGSCNAAHLGQYYRDGYETCLYGKIVGSGYNDPWTFVQFDDDENDVVIAIYDVNWKYSAGVCLAASGEIYTTNETIFIIAWEGLDVRSCTTEQARASGLDPHPAPTRQTIKPVASGCPNGCYSPPAGCTIKGNVSYNTGEKIYHMPGDYYYYDTVINTVYGERWFCTANEAEANGWRRTYR
jgi:hypothetical protein